MECVLFVVGWIKLVCWSYKILVADYIGTGLFSTIVEKCFEKVINKIMFLSITLSSALSTLLD